MKKKSRNKIKIIWKESSLPAEEKKRRLFEALKMLINEGDLSKLVLPNINKIK